MATTVKVFQRYINDLREYSLSSNESRFVAKQLLELYSEVLRRGDVTVLELGVDKGQSTKVFLNGMAGKPSSHLVSVDIRDCSCISNANNWTFVQKDSADIHGVINSAPILKSGIDILYVDSLHTPEHVRREIYGYFPYLTKGAVIFFDDIHSDPYMMGQRKDSVHIEIANREIFELIEAVFRANRNTLNMIEYHGSTGLCRLEKLSEIGQKLNEPVRIKKRNNKLFWRIVNSITNKKQYHHDINANDSFLIDVTKYCE